ncbi:MAG: hypothetical protein AAF596_10860 [Planctomycetota bacterium]
MTDSHEAIIAQEEAKRERNWPPGQRWASFIAAVEWADGRQPVRRNTRERRLEIQRQKITAYYSNSSEETSSS